MKEEKLLQSIRNNFPSIKWKNYEVKTNGWDHIAVILDDKIVFRFPKEKEYKDILIDETRLLDYLSTKIEANIPRYSLIARDQSFAGYNMLSGISLTKNQFDELPKEDITKIAKQLAHFISQLHSIPKQKISGYNIETKNRQKIYERVVNGTREIVFPHIDQQKINEIEIYFNELKESLNHQYEYTLIHNDLSKDHILWDNDKKQINIIDFSDRTISDPALDFCHILEYGEGFVKDVINLYTGPSKEHLLQRARLYIKMFGLHIMEYSLKEYPCTLEEGYNLFKSF